MKLFFLVLFVFVGLGSSFSFAQDGIVDCIMQRKIVVQHVRGRVFDPSGIPVSGAQISLIHDKLMEAQSKTDSDGSFDLTVPAGSYAFKAEFRGFEVTTADLEVGSDVVNLIHPKALKVILALTGMNCPWVTTSSKEFKDLVHKRALQK